MCTLAVRPCHMGQSDRHCPYKARERGVATATAIHRALSFCSTPARLGSRLGAWEAASTQTFSITLVTSASKVGEAVLLYVSKNSHSVVVCRYTVLCIWSYSSQRLALGSTGSQISQRSPSLVTGGSWGSVVQPGSCADDHCVRSVPFPPASLLCGNAHHSAWKQ